MNVVKQQGVVWRRRDNTEHSSRWDALKRYHTGKQWSGKTPSVLHHSGVELITVLFIGRVLSDSLMGAPVLELFLLLWLILGSPIIDLKGGMANRIVDRSMEAMCNEWQSQHRCEAFYPTIIQFHYKRITLMGKYIATPLRNHAPQMIHCSADYDAGDPHKPLASHRREIHLPLWTYRSCSTFLMLSAVNGFWLNIRLILFTPVFKSAVVFFSSELNSSISFWLSFAFGCSSVWCILSCCNLLRVEICAS